MGCSSTDSSLHDCTLGGRSGAQSLVVGEVAEVEVFIVVQVDVVVVVVVVVVVEAVVSHTF